MTSLSTRRPLFLSGAQRRNMIIRRYAMSLSILALSVFAAGFFFGGLI